MSRPEPGSSVVKISRRAALGALDQKPGLWHCIPCWGAALGVGPDANADLAEIARGFARRRIIGIYDASRNDLCGVESTFCEKKLTGAAAFSRWAWGVRRKRA